MTSITSDGRVEFKFFRAGAQAVSIVGDFNDWDDRASTMTRDEQGWWTASMQMAGGEYRFRYLADGEWFVDYASYGIQPSNSGINSVLLVPHRHDDGPADAPKEVA